MRAAAGLLAVAHLGVLAVALSAAPALAADRDGGGGLSVSTTSVSFDASRLRHESGWLGYVVTAPDGSHQRSLGDVYSRTDSADGVLELEVPQRGAYRDGYCVTWVMVTGIDHQFAGWNGDSAVCTTTQAASPPPAAPEPEPSAEEPPAASEPVPAQPAEPEPVQEQVEEPTPADQATEEPTEEPTTETPSEPTPTPGPATAAPEPSRTPLTSAAKREAPVPEDASFPTLAVVGVGGLVAAAAGGSILLLRRLG